MKVIDKFNSENERFDEESTKKK